ncbi:hypothetical protein LTR85_002744 [Meristemomyces frigidus]|nr:hypothetical protein LTR85_002744 [Meristemomyces frigidus]
MPADGTGTAAGSSTNDRSQSNKSRAQSSAAWFSTARHGSVMQQSDTTACSKGLSGEQQTTSTPYTVQRRIQQQPGEEPWDISRSAERQTRK